MAPADPCRALRLASRGAAENGLAQFGLYDRFEVVSQIEALPYHSGQIVPFERAPDVASLNAQSSGRFSRGHPDRPEALNIQPSETPRFNAGDRQQASLVDEPTEVHG